MRRSPLGLWLALGLLAALSTWASWSLYRPLPVPAKRAHGADHLFIQPSARVFNLQGQPAYDIRGQRLEHRAESGDYLLDAAELLFYPEDATGAAPAAPPAAREHWHLKAERARVLADREHVQLENAVSAERLGVAPQARITLQARDVTLAYRAQTASSAQAAVVDGAGWQSQASAFSANLSTEHIEQEGRVHDRYQPQPE